MADRDADTRLFNIEDLMKAAWAPKAPDAFSPYIRSLAVRSMKTPVLLSDKERQDLASAISGAVRRRREEASPRRV